MTQENHQLSQLDVLLEQDNIPIHYQVRTVCEMLGFDPLYLASGGRVAAVMDESCASGTLKIWKQIP